jgi:hypothetical protein
MVLYYSREYHSSSIGIRIVEVTCDKCSSEYYYELARIGSGKASAPFAIGTAGAAQQSTNQAEKDLDRRLADEAELVPCPKCSWINESLVAGYRKSKYRGWTKFALGLGFFGTIASLLMAWFLSNGPAADRDTLPYILIGGPAISIGLALLIFLGRGALRSRIKPNRSFPDMPKLPRGCPVALVMNPATGQIEPAISRPDQVTLDDEWIDFQIGRIGLPLSCCGCLGPPDAQSAFRQPLSQAVELVVPCCGSCLQARKWKSRKYGLITLALTALVAVPILIALKLDEVVFWMSLIGLCTVVPYLFGTTLADSTTIPVRVKFVDRSRGIIRLWFRNENYRKLIFDGA